MRYIDSAIRYHAADAGQALVEFGFMRIIFSNSVTVACSGNLVFRSSRAIGYFGSYAVNIGREVSILIAIFYIALNCAIAAESDRTSASTCCFTLTSDYKLVSNQLAGSNRTAVNISCLTAAIGEGRTVSVRSYRVVANLIDDAVLRNRARCIVRNLACNAFVRYVDGA